MGFCVEYPEWETAVSESELKNYGYALLYNIEKICLCGAAGLKAEDFEECMEARIFRQDAELHLFPQEKKAIRVLDEGSEHVLTRKYELAGKYKKAAGARYFLVRHYLEPDEDGQMVIAMTRLAGICS